LQGSTTIGQNLAIKLVEQFLITRLQANPDTLERSGDPRVLTITGILPRGRQQFTIRSEGTDAAFSGLVLDQCDVGMASRQIPVDIAHRIAPLVGDMLAPACEHVIGIDGIAVIVSGANQLRALDRPTIAGIFEHRITNWANVPGAGLTGDIHCIVREEQESGTKAVFESIILRHHSVSERCRLVQGSQAVADEVVHDDAAISFVSFAYVKGGIHALSISDDELRALAPTPSTIATEDYILTRRLYLYTEAHPVNDTTPRFIDFALSKKGQVAVAEAGFVPLGVHVIADAPVTRSPAIDSWLDQASRLSANVRFISGSDRFDSKV
jgi:phosphate transport system substrate-binding protein